MGFPLFHYSITKVMSRACLCGVLDDGSLPDRLPFGRGASTCEQVERSPVGLLCVRPGQIPQAGFPPGRGQSRRPRADRSGPGPSGARPARASSLREHEASEERRLIPLAPFAPFVRSSLVRRRMMHSRVAPTPTALRPRKNPLCSFGLACASWPSSLDRGRTRHLCRS